MRQLGLIVLRLGSTRAKKSPSIATHDDTDTGMRPIWSQIGIILNQLRLISLQLGLKMGRLILILNTDSDTDTDIDTG